MGREHSFLVYASEYSVYAAKWQPLAARHTVISHSRIWFMKWMFLVVRSLLATRPLSSIPERRSFDTI